MDDLRFRRLRALRAALDSPFFGQAVEELRRELADEIADCIDPVKAGALRAERVALTRLAGRIETYTNELMIVEKQVNG